MHNKMTVSEEIDKQILCEMIKICTSWDTIKCAFVVGWLMCKENMQDVHVLGEEARKTPEEMFEQSFSKIITKG